MSSSTDRRLAAAVAAAAALVVGALVMVTRSSRLHDAFVLVAVGIAWYATDRALRTTQALAERGREQGDLFDQMLRTIDESAPPSPPACTTARSRR